MKNKKITKVFIILIVILFSLLIIWLLFKEKEYTIKIEKVDQYSTDVKLIVLANNKEINDYVYIKYNDNSEIILCYAKNAVVNIHELDNIEELIIGFEKNKEIIAKILN